MTEASAQSSTSPSAARKRTPRGEGRARLIGAATELFSERGVGGTSLQAIADRLGVTKAAVYHQFATKDEIVLAVAEGIIVHLAAVADAAESHNDPHLRIATTIEGLAAIVVRERGLAAVFRTDPAMAQILDGHGPYVRQIARIDAILLGPAPSVERRIAFAFAGGGVMALGWDRSLDDIPAEALQPAIAAAMSRALAIDGESGPA